MLERACYESLEDDTNRMGTASRQIELETPHGPARVHLQAVDSPRAALLLGHGAGGGVESPDLVGAARAAHEAGLAVALVEQPYRVAGRRSPAPANQLDAAWVSVVEQLAFDVPLIAGGRSSGARVACRTAAATGASAVLCLAFPLHPPGRPEKSRLDELDAVTVPTLVVQGERDPFGDPPPGASRTVVHVPGTHSLRDPAAVAGAVADWLHGLAI
jgi:predicted alpha/beta-hydrolase family hydrolase